MSFRKTVVLQLAMIFLMLPYAFLTSEADFYKHYTDGDFEFEKKNYVAAMESYQFALSQVDSTDKEIHLELGYNIALCLLKLKRESGYYQEFTDYIDEYIQEAKGTYWETKAYYLKGTNVRYANNKKEAHPLELARLAYDKSLYGEQFEVPTLVELDSRLLKVLEERLRYRRRQYNDVDSLEVLQKKSLEEESEKYNKEWDIHKKIVYLYREVKSLTEGKKNKIEIQYNFANYLRRNSGSIPKTYSNRAIAIFQNLVENAPIQSIREDSQYALALHYKELGDFIAAEQEFERMKELFPESYLNMRANIVLAGIRKEDVEFSIGQSQVIPPAPPSDATHEEKMRYRNKAHSDFENKTIFLPGEEITGRLTVQNISEIDLEVYSINLPKILLKTSKRSLHARDLSDFDRIDQYFKPIIYDDLTEDQLKKYKTTRRNSKLLYAINKSDLGEKDGKRRTITIQLNDPRLGIGTYLFVARSKDKIATQLIAISDLALITKTAGEQGIAFVANAITGEPVSGAEVVMIHGSKRHKGKTNNDGLFTTKLKFRKYKNRRESRYWGEELSAFAFLGKRFIACPTQQTSRLSQRIRTYTFTDRPIYRPDQTVYFKHIFRKSKDGVFAPVKNKKVQVKLRNSRRKVVLDSTFRTSDTGSVIGQYLLPEDAPLGRYSFEILIDEVGVQLPRSGNFRVEEYKRPEFKLTVEADESTLTIGDTLKIIIKAENYFGGVVPYAKVNYSISRSIYRQLYFLPTEYDWLYGEGFANKEPKGWNRRWSDDEFYWSRWHYRYYHPNTLERNKDAKTDSNGNLIIEIPTEQLLSDEWDGSYIFKVTATGTDASRRQVNTVNYIVLPAREFSAFIDSDKNFFSPKEEAQFTVRTINHKNIPQNVTGEVTICKLIPVENPNKDQDPYEEERIYSQKITTKSGTGNFAWSSAISGFFRIRFTALDSREQEVIATNEIWIIDKDLSGQLYGFEGIDIITDKQLYTEGEIAHLLIMTQKPGGYVFFTTGSNDLFFTKKVIKIDGYSKTIPIKVTQKHVPNFFISAYSIRNAAIHSDKCQVFVPPATHLIRMEVTSDKETYLPGETGTFSIKTTDTKGNPISSEVNLSVFDASLLGIQQVRGKGLLEYYYGGLRGDMSGYNDSSRYKLSSQKYSPYDKHGYSRGRYPDIGEWEPDGFSEISRNFLSRFRDVELEPARPPKSTLPKIMQNKKDVIELTMEIPEKEKNEIINHTELKSPSKQEQTTTKTSKKGQTGKITGTVVDEDGDPLYGANVAVIGTSKGAMTDKDGQYTIFLEQGTYDIKASFIGYSPETKINIFVEADSVVVVAFELSEGAMDIGVSITCSAKSFIIEKDQTTTGSHHSGTVIGNSIGELLSPKSNQPAPQKRLVPAVRTDFSETAYWNPMINTDKEGMAEIKCQFPDAATAWKAVGGAITAKTQIGGAEPVEVRTSQPIIVRLQAPRYFIERDEVILSAIVGNYTDSTQVLAVTLKLDDKLTFMEGVNKVEEITLLPEGQERLDWRTKVVNQGETKVLVSAVTQTDGDAMEMKFPVHPYGKEKMVAHLGNFENDEEIESFTLTVPDDIREGSQKLEINFSPSIAGITLDALPYLVDYPYGCFEQTINRFIPAVLVKKTLQDMGIDLENMKSESDMTREEVPAYWKSPVYNEDELDKMIKEGTKKISKFQSRNGGFGWWNGRSSDEYMTAIGINALTLARSCGVPVGKSMIEDAVDYLIKKLDNYDFYQRDVQVYMLYAISNYNPAKVDLLRLNHMYKNRDKLSYYSWALLGLTYGNLLLDELGEFDAGDPDYSILSESDVDSLYWEKINILKENLLDRLRFEKESGTAYWSPEALHWWYWWNDRVETTATALQFLNRVEPENESLPFIVKWLVNERKGNKWRSTKDTALCIFVLLEYARTHGELEPDYELTVSLDNKPLKNFHITSENMLTFDNKILIDSDELASGEHTIEIIKKGKGNLYYSAFIEYFTTEEEIDGAGNEIFISRKYYKINGDDKKEIEMNEVLNSGDIVDVELTIDAKNDYQYLVFEDMKPAGCEFVQQKSRGGYMELRDEKIVFFKSWLRQGETILKYRLRAEIPGKFNALPSDGRAMYAPDVRSISDNFRIEIKDK